MGLALPDLETLLISLTFEVMPGKTGFDGIVRGLYRGIFSPDFESLILCFRSYLPIGLDFCFESIFLGTSLVGLEGL